MAHLTPQQYAAIKAEITADPVLAAQPMNSDGAYNIAAALNLPASPDFIVWKTSVTSQEIGNAMNANEVGGLTTANTNRLMVMERYSGGTFSPARADMRAGFDGVFSGAGGALTRAALLTLYKRSATRFEKVLATGTGTDASPATITAESPVAYNEIEIARAA